jgi:hypothetical protein
MNEGELFYAFEKLTDFNYEQSSYTNKYGLIDELVFEDDVFEFSLFNGEIINKTLSILGFIFLLNIPITLINIFI